MVDRLANCDANARRINFVESCFGTSGQPLAIPHRVLVGEGVLTKVCRKKPKSRQFFLFNDIIVYGSILIAKRKYNRQHIIPLENVKLQSIDNTQEMHNAWQVSSPNKSFIVSAATAQEKTEWMAHINKCVQDLLRKQGKNYEQVENSPVWVPDYRATTCMECRKSSFTVINRRHHCRKCGRVVCNSCSNKRWMLPQQSSKPLRVCIKCFNSLSCMGKVEKAVGETSPTQDSSGEESSDDDEANTDAMENQPTFYEDK